MMKSNPRHHQCPTVSIVPSFSISCIVPVIPPLTEIHWAVIHRLFSDTSKASIGYIFGRPQAIPARVC